MNKKTKKIIAREFLILFALIVSGLLTFVCIFPYNLYQQKRINEIENIISERKAIADSLNKSVSEKLKNQKWYHKKITDKFNFTKPVKSFWLSVSNHTQNDSVNYHWNNNWTNNLIEYHKTLGFNNAQELESFIKNNSLNKQDSIKLEKTDHIRKEISDFKNRKIKLENKYFDEYDRMELLTGIGIILFGILFLLRYLFYAVKWSIKILKE